MTNVNSNVLFLTPLHSLSPDAYRQLAQPISYLARIAANRLLIVLVSPRFHVRHDTQEIENEAGACQIEDNTTRPGPENTSQPRHKKDGSISDLESEPIHWEAVQRLLTFVYVQASKIASEQKNILLQVDVLLKSPDELRVFELPLPSARPVQGGMDTIGSSLSQREELEFEVMYKLNGDDLELSPALARIPQRTLSGFAPTSGPRLTQNVTTTPQGSIPMQEQDSDEQGGYSRFPVTALGGTFDHLHAGHKILLSVAAWLTSRKLIAGVTDTSLLGSKSYPQFLESLEVRIAKTREFLTLFKPSLEYDVVPIKDVYGPTGWDADVQALVVSKETISGAKSIATHRAAHNLPPLQTFVIDVISHLDENIILEDANDLRKAKMSSTAIREWLAGQR